MTPGHNRCSRTITLFVIICIVFGISACGTSKPAGVSFSGEWKIVSENFISGDKETSTARVVTDGTRFRIESEYRIQVYDGTNLHSKSKRTIPENMPDNINMEIPAAETYTSPLTKFLAKQYTFWISSRGKKEGPGGTIAGRETILYQAGGARSDGEIRLQTWVDAEKGIVLKSINSIYSRQIEQMVTTVTHECRSIDYDGMIDEASFSKP